MFQETKKYSTGGKDRMWPVAQKGQGVPVAAGGTETVRTKSVRVVSAESGPEYADLMAAIQELGPGWIYFDALELKMTEHVDAHGRRKVKRTITLL